MIVREIVEDNFGHFSWCISSARVRFQSGICRNQGANKTGEVGSAEEGVGNIS